MNDELTKLWRTVEATEHVYNGLRDKMLERASYGVSPFQPFELTDSEHYLLGIAARQLAEVKAAYQDAYTRWLVSRDCSKDDRDRAPGRSSDSPAEGS